MKNNERFTVKEAIAIVFAFLIIVAYGLVDLAISLAVLVGSVAFVFAVFALLIIVSGWIGG